MARTITQARTIEEFLRQRKRDTDVDSIRVKREKRRDRFIAETDALFERIKGWLQKLSKVGPIFIRERPISLYEEGIGEYKLRELLVDVADHLIIIRPIGTMIYGSMGRVDIIGNSETQLIMPAWGKWQLARGTYANRPASPPVPYSIEGALKAAGTRPRIPTDLTEEEFKNVLFLLVSD